MEKKRRPWRGLVAAVASILLYLLLFPHPLGREPVLRPRWAVTVPAGTPAAAGGTVPSAVTPFQLGERFGYVTSDGEVTFAATASFRVALAKRGFVAFSRVGSTWILDDPSGAPLATFSGDGYPLLSADGERLFLVRTDLTALRELDDSGEVLWSREFATLITSTSVASDWMAVGLLDGSVALLDRSGSVAFEHAVGGSRLQVTFGVAVASDGSRLATITGIDPQQITLFQHRGAAWRESARVTLGTDLRREVRVAFAPGGRWLVCEARGGALLLEAATGRTWTIAQAGGLAGVAFLPRGGGGAAPAACVLAARADSVLEVTVVRPGAGVLYRGAAEQRGPWSRGAEATWLGTAGGTVVLGAAEQLLGFDLEAR